MRRSFHPARRSTPSYGEDTPYTGYYKDGGGYAWYYNDEDKYVDLIAAPPSSATKKRSRYMPGSTSGSVYDAALRVARAGTDTTLAAVLANAQSSGGVLLPDPDGLARGIAAETALTVAEKEEAGMFVPASPSAPSSPKSGKGKRSVGRKKGALSRSSGGLTTIQKVGIGAVGVGLLVAAAFAIRKASS
jgi:hypothetical protein